MAEGLFAQRPFQACFRGESEDRGGEIFLLLSQTVGGFVQNFEVHRVTRAV